MEYIICLKISRQVKDPRTKKAIDLLPEHAQHIFKKAYANAVKQYQDPEKRRGGKTQSAEEVAHKAAWAAVKQKYKKQGTDELLKINYKKICLPIKIPLNLLNSS